MKSPPTPPWLTAALLLAGLAVWFLLLAGGALIHQLTQGL